MKLAYLAPEFYPPWGGVGTYSVNLIRELSRLKGMDIHVFTPTRGDQYDPDAVTNIFDDKITLHNLSHATDHFFYNFKFQHALWKEFRKFQERERFDLVHAANLVHMPDIFLKMSGFKAPSLTTAHTTIGGQVRGFLSSNRNFLRMAPSEKMSLMLYPAIRFLELQYLARTKHAITVSKKFGDELRRAGYMGKIYTVHNGIDPAVFNYARTKIRYGKFPFLKKITSPIVLFAGRLVTQKGISIFVAAMKEVLEKRSDVHFVIAGPGDLSNLKRLLHEAGIPQDKYTYAGIVPNSDLASLYKAASVFVLPSFYENFPISVLEASAMRCACIATDVGATSEFVNEKTGILLKMGDSRALSSSICQLLGDTAKRKRLAAAAQKSVLRTFTAKIMAKKTRDVYQTVLA